MDESHEHAPKVLWSTFTHHIIHIMGWVGTVSSQMDWERLPVAPLYVDVRAYCSHVKMYCKRVCLLSSHPRLFIHSFIHCANFLCTLHVFYSLSSVSGMSCAGTICTGTHGTGKNYGIVATFVSFFSLFTLFNPFAPENFAEKRVLKLVEPFSGHCLAKKSQDLPQSCLQVTPFVALIDLCSFWYRLKDFFTLHIS